MVNIQKNLFNTYQFNNRGFGIELEFAYSNIADENISWSQSKAIKIEALKKACDLAEQHQDIFKGLRIVHDGSKHVAIEIVFPILFDHENSWNSQPGAPNRGKPLVRGAQKPSQDPGQTDYPIPALREAKVEAFREAQISETGRERSPETTPKSLDGRTHGRTDPPNTKYRVTEESSLRSQGVEL